MDPTNHPADPEVPMAKIGGKDIQELKLFDEALMLEMTLTKDTEDVPPFDAIMDLVVPLVLPVLDPLNRLRLSGVCASMSPLANLYPIRCHLQALIKIWSEWETR